MIARRLLPIIVATVASFASAPALAAQAYSYPSMQIPLVSNRDYTAAVSVAKGTAAFFQWREGINSEWHFSLDAGLGDPEGRNNDLVAFGGGGVAAQVLRSTSEQPLDLLVTGSFGVAVGAGQTVVRLPVGVSMGHRFPFEGGVSLTPYIHPRLSFDRCYDCNGNNRNSSEVSVNFDVGLSFEVSPKFAIRASGSFSGSDIVPRNDAFALGFNWIPSPLSTRK
ncbi:MAG: outer membrane beta-barrel protein [Phycisphaerae bacterium]|nr:outer membrane beta-barrel protein [Gemmatimonadaceae bacterium]